MPTVRRIKDKGENSKAAPVSNGQVRLRAVFVWKGVLPSCYFYGLWANGLKSFSLASLIDNLLLGIAVGDTELNGASGRYVTRKFFCQLGNHLVNIAETDVCKFGYHFSLEIGPSANHHLLGYAEQLVCRSLNVTRFALLALLVTEKDEVDDLGVKFPCRGEVYLDIATGDIQPVAVVHAERHFIKVRVTVVLGMVAHVCLNV